LQPPGSSATIDFVADSYYARRSARDPAWHAQQLREAAAREQRRREADPEGFRRARRQIDADYRRRIATHGLTFAELHRRVGGDRLTLLTVLNSERARGTIDYSSTMRRYSLCDRYEKPADRGGAGAASAEVFQTRGRRPRCCQREQSGTKTAL
jgi:hypothetical protein